MTLRRVAERIEYSATTIYLYFANKETLIQALCSDDFVAYSRVLLQAERVGGPLARLRKIAAGIRRFRSALPGTLPRDVHDRSKRERDERRRSDDGAIAGGVSPKESPQTLPRPAEPVRLPAFRSVQGDGGRVFQAAIP